MPRNKDFENLSKRTQLRIAKSLAEDSLSSENSDSVSVKINFSNSFFYEYFTLFYFNENFYL